MNGKNQCGQNDTARNRDHRQPRAVTALRKYGLYGGFTAGNSAKEFADQIGHVDATPGAAGLGARVQIEGNGRAIRSPR